MLIAKLLLALTGFNFYVMSTGLTYLEFKSMLEGRARDLNLKFYGKIETTGNPRQDEQKSSLMKFHYGFSSHLENIWRVLKTKNLLFGVFFTQFGEDTRLEFNGTEWTVYYYFNEIMRVHRDPEKIELSE